MNEHAFSCFFDREDGDSPLLAAWVLRFTIPYTSFIAKTGSTPLPISWLKAIRSVENADMQDLMLLFLDEAKGEDHSLLKNSVAREKKLIAEQYCNFMEEISLPACPEVRHHLQDVIRAESANCIPSSIVYALHTGTPYYSYDSIMNAVFQCNIRGLETRHLIFLLAATGIETCLPNIYLGKTFASLSLDEVITASKTGAPVTEAEKNIARIRSNFSGELDDYRTEILEMCAGAYDLIKAGDYSEAERWAKHKAYTNILLAVRRLETAIVSDSKNIIKRIAVGALNGIPAIAQECKPGGAPLRTAAAELLKVLVGALAIEKKKYPIASYACLLKRQLSNSIR